MQSHLWCRRNTNYSFLHRSLYQMLSYARETDIDQRALSRGMITVLLWKKACINLFITYFNIELKRTKLTFLCLDFSYFLQKSPFLLPKPQRLRGVTFQKPFFFNSTNIKILPVLPTISDF
jgi:hypothetical protein